ncbi:MAG TPA: hypothetical protein VF992_07160 [Thermoplasmata archaeon]
MILILSFCWLFELFLVLAILVFLTGSIPDPERSTVLGILAAAILAWTLLTSVLTVAVWRAWQVAIPSTSRT